jgi:hypothetical protein
MDNIYSWLDSYVHIPVLLLEQMQEVGQDFRRFGLLKGKRKAQYAAMSGKPRPTDVGAASRSSVSK